MNSNTDYKLRELAKKISQCQKCELCKTRDKVVVGDGNNESEIMFVGNIPSEKDNEIGIPFIDKTGILLDRMLASINLDRTKVYVCNILKCFPKARKGYSQDNIDKCMDYLRCQFLIIKPKLIVLLGKEACSSVLGKDFSIENKHGRLFIKKGIIFVPTFHPNDLIRDESKKNLAWEDFKVIRAIIRDNNFKQ